MKKYLDDSLTSQMMGKLRGSILAEEERGVREAEKLMISVRKKC